MAGAYANQKTDGKVTLSVGNWIGVLEYTAPTGAPARMPKPFIEFTATASTAPTNRVRMVQSNSASSNGTTNNPVAKTQNNPAGVPSLGSGKRAVATGDLASGTTVWEHEFKGFGAFQIQHDDLIPPGKTLQIQCMAGGACEANAGWSGIEI